MKNNSFLTLTRPKVSGLKKILKMKKNFKEREVPYALLGSVFLVLALVTKIVIKNPSTLGIIVMILIIVTSGLFFIPSIRSGMRRKRRLEELRGLRKNRAK
jgi:hypothetical protein